MKIRVLYVTAMLVLLFIIVNIGNAQAQVGDGAPDLLRSAPALMQTATAMKGPASEYPDVIIHACGVVDGVVGTNSMDALAQSFDRGCRFIEMDFNWTSDGDLALIHDWDQMDKFCPSLPANIAPTSAEFTACKIMGKYQSLTIGPLARWLREHRDVNVITDIKADNVKALRFILENYPDIMPQLIVQIYDYEEFSPVNKMGYDRIILTLYKMSYADKTNAKKIASFAKKNSLYAVTFDETLLDVLDEDQFIERDVPIYTHTINDPGKAETTIKSGVTGVYSDLLIPDDLNK